MMVEQKIILSQEARSCDTCKHGEVDGTICLQKEKGTMPFCGSTAKYDQWERRNVSVIYEKGGSL